MTTDYFTDVATARTAPTDAVAAGNPKFPWRLPDGADVTYDRIEALADKFGWIWNVGSQTTPATFAGAYDADGPDFFAHIPGGLTFLPLSIEVKFEAIGTQALLEVMAALSPQGDSTATISGGALATESPMQVNRGGAASGLTVSGGVDAAGITDNHVAGAIDFWRDGEITAITPTDTATADAEPHTRFKYEWNRKKNGFGPRIRVPAGSTGSMCVHACSQAGTGYIYVAALVIPNDIADLIFPTS